MEQRSEPVAILSARRYAGGKDFRLQRLVSRAMTSKIVELFANRSDTYFELYVQGMQSVSANGGCT